MTPPQPPHPSSEHRHTLVRVVLDLAEDLGYACAVAVVDAAGRLLTAERAPSLDEAALDRAVAAARASMAAGATTGPGVAGQALREDGGVVGAVGVAGGPEGFPAEAATSAAAAAGLMPPAVRPGAPSRR